MLKSTENIVREILQADPATKNKVQEVLLLIGAPGYTPVPISESEAARILGLPQSSLNRWRNGKRGKKFPFKVMQSPVSDSVLYNEDEIKEYVCKNFKTQEDF